MNLPRPLRAAVYHTFYRLPPVVRRRIVRLFVQRYVVGAVVLVRDSEAASPGRLLLLRQPPSRGWGLPAGLLQRREPPHVGGARELAEETGLAVDPDQLRPATPSAVVHAAGWVDVVFETSVNASTARLTVDGAEVLEAAFHPLDNLPRLTSASARLLGIYGIGPLAADTTRPRGAPAPSDRVAVPRPQPDTRRPADPAPAGDAETGGQATGSPT